jgi:hypothetical protein
VSYNKSGCGDTQPSQIAIRGCGLTVVASSCSQVPLSLKINGIGYPTMALSGGCTPRSRASGRDVPGALLLQTINMLQRTASRNALPDWSKRFADPILIPNCGKPLLSLRDAAAYITALPKEEQQAPQWRLPPRCCCWSPSTVATR